MSDQIPTGTFSRPVSAELARVLAQAADSAYAPHIFFVVARYEPAEPGAAHPFNIQPPLASYEHAKELVARLGILEPGVAYGIFGPFQNGHPDFPRRTEQATVARFKVVTQRRGTLERSFTIGGEEFDALFYSVQAVEKFVVPYYVQEYGVDFGKMVLDRFQRAPLAMVGHLPWSEEVQIVDKSEGAAPMAAGAGARTATRTRYVPVFFEDGGDGAVLPQPLYPSVPGPGAAAAVSARPDAAERGLAEDVLA